MPAASNEQKEFLLGLAAFLGKVEKILTTQAVPGEGWKLLVDPASLTVATEKRRSEALTAKEFQIVTWLNEAPTKTLDRKSLLGKVWRDIKISPKTLDVHIFNIRKKLAPLEIQILFTEPDSFRMVRHVAAVAKSSSSELASVG